MPALSARDRAILEFACCTFYLQTKPAADEPAAPPESLPPTDMAGAADDDGNDDDFGLEADDAIDDATATVPSSTHSAPANSLHIDAETPPEAPPSVLAEALMEMAGTLLYADPGSVVVREHLIASLAHLAFKTTARGLRPTNDCETIVRFWCNCVSMGLRGEYDHMGAWSTNWLWVLRCADLLLLNVAPMGLESAAWRTSIVRALDGISQACLGTQNKVIGKAIFDWVMELAQAL
ncbi:hypothetical protein SPRG_00042 [Saprolegnia parasitica CBS 223.65]|uniref:Uncharacterized protein n=1 Tax=Saprolegnia parasitica (strain CBS 223.65) TaxID=695850 RepID=A0A067D9B3_SAPPC|nr:hypothetical protein SPRG_00042 [Saprolegnia parasitica CBS 223.65]KDO35196.1 hypothetical protein SPRG_00042 [Saprolegnia parasitica CBS 223.65]|eukprot:XP_012193548.1 hypothetical protein SPRG_00042 [Saprolegnia parasitica CBS 223.65]